MEDISLATAWVSFLHVFRFFFLLLLSLRYFLFVLLPMCRQTVETQRGKNTKNERARKQCPIASDNNQTWSDIGIPREEQNTGKKESDENVLTECAE